MELKMWNLFGLEKRSKRGGLSQLKKLDPRHAWTTSANKAQPQSLKNCLNHRTLSSSSSPSEHSSSRNSKNSGKSIRESVSWPEFPMWIPLTWQNCKMLAQNLHWYKFSSPATAHLTLQCVPADHAVNWKPSVLLYNSWRNNLVPRWGQCC